MEVEVSATPVILAFVLATFRPEGDTDGCLGIHAEVFLDHPVVLRSGHDGEEGRFGILIVIPFTACDNKDGTETDLLLLFRR